MTGIFFRGIRLRVSICVAFVVLLLNSSVSGVGETPIGGLKLTTPADGGMYNFTNLGSVVSVSIVSSNLSVSNIMAGTLTLGTTTLTNWITNSSWGLITGTISSQTDLWSYLSWVQGVSNTINNGTGNWNTAYSWVNANSNNMVYLSRNNTYSSNTTQDMYSAVIGKFLSVAVFSNATTTPVPVYLGSYKIWDWGWNAVFPKVPILANDGSVTAPAYAFDLDNSVGMYRYGPGILGFSALGTNTFSVSSTGVTVVGGLTLGGITQTNWPNSGVWGLIAGSLNSQTDLWTELTNRYTKSEINGFLTNTGNWNTAYDWVSANSNGVASVFSTTGNWNTAYSWVNGNSNSVKNVGGLTNWGSARIDGMINLVSNNMTNVNVIIFTNNGSIKMTNLNGTNAFQISDPAGTNIGFVLLGGTPPVAAQLGNGQTFTATNSFTNTTYMGIVTASVISVTGNVSAANFSSFGKFSGSNFITASMVYGITNITNGVVFMETNTITNACIQSIRAAASDLRNITFNVGRMYDGGNWVDTSRGSNGVSLQVQNNAGLLFSRFDTNSVVQTTVLTVSTNGGISASGGLSVPSMVGLVTNIDTGILFKEGVVTNGVMQSIRVASADLRNIMFNVGRMFDGGNWKDTSSGSNGVSFQVQNNSGLIFSRFITNSLTQDVKFTVTTNGDVTATSFRGSLWTKRPDNTFTGDVYSIDATSFSQGGGTVSVFNLPPYVPDSATALRFRLSIKSDTVGQPFIFYCVTNSYGVSNPFNVLTTSGIGFVTPAANVYATGPLLEVPIFKWGGTNVIFYNSALTGTDNSTRFSNITITDWR